MTLTCCRLSPLPTPFTCPDLDQVPGFVPLQRSPRRFKREEAQPWLDSPFDEPMILLHHVVELFHLPQFAGGGNGPGVFAVVERASDTPRFSRR
jgi:hypothetical protein